MMRGYGVSNTKVRDRESRTSTSAFSEGVMHSREAKSWKFVVPETALAGPCTVTNPPRPKQRNIEATYEEYL